MEEDIVRRTKYTISLEDFEFGSLPIQFARGARTLPLWRNSNNDYYEVEIHETPETEDEFAVSGDDSKTTCYICDIEVPKAFLYEHINGPKHRTFLQIVENAMERARKHILHEFPIVKSNNSMHYCDSCSVVVNSENFEDHNKSNKHQTSKTHDKLLSKLLRTLTERGSKGETENSDTDIAFTFKSTNDSNMNGETKEIANGKLGNIENATGDSKAKLHKENLSNLIAKIKNATKSETMPFSEENHEHDSNQKLVYDVTTLKDLGTVTGNETKMKESTVKNTKLPDEVNWDLYEKYTKLLGKNIHSLKHTQGIDIVDVTTMNGSTVRIHRDNYEGFVKVGDEVYCKMCQVTIDENNSNHRYSKQHVMKLMKPLEDVHCIRKIDEKQNFCVICNEIVSVVPLHILCSENHRSNLEAAWVTESKPKLSNPENSTHKATQKTQPPLSTQSKPSQPSTHPNMKILSDKIALCTVCDRIIHIQTFPSHVTGRSHKANAAKILEEQEEAKANAAKMLEEQENARKMNQNDKVHFCKVCQVKVPNTPKCIKTHENGTPHKNKLASLQNGVGSSQNEAATTHPNPKGYFCAFCQVTMPDTAHNINEHLLGNNHRMTLQKLLLESSD